MGNLILVLNAGSSSLKFTHLRRYRGKPGGALRRPDRGHRHGAPLQGERRRRERSSRRKNGLQAPPLTTKGPLMPSLPGAGEFSTARTALWPWGTVSFTAVSSTRNPPSSTITSWKTWKNSCPWRRFISRTTWHPSASSQREIPACPRWPASTPPFTRASLPWPRPSPCRRKYHRARGPALRLPRPLLRVHLHGPAGG